MAYLTEQHRLNLTAGDHRLLDDVLVMTCRLYNAGLEDRRNSYEYGKRLALRNGLASPYELKPEHYLDESEVRWEPSSRASHFGYLTQIRADDPEGYGALPTNIGRDVLVQLDEAFAGFFSRVKKGKTPGYPRFKSISRWKSFGWDDMNGVTIVGDRIVFQAFGVKRSIRFKRHRDWPPGTEPCSLRLVKKTNRWEVHVQVSYPVEGEIKKVKPVFPKKAELDALDDPELVKAIRGECRAVANRKNAALEEAHEQRLAVEFMDALKRDEVRAYDANIVNCASNDQGLVLPNDRIGRKAAKVRSKTEQWISNCRKRSSRWKKARKRLKRLHEKAANARRTRAHQESALIVRTSKFVVLEALQVDNMTKSASGTVEKPGTNVAAHSARSREFLDTCPSTRARYIAYKAERAGGMVVEVHPAYTSMRCSGCRVLGKPDKDRMFRCAHCGLTLDRDVNAPRNMLQKSRAVVGPVAMKARKHHGEACLAGARILN